MKKYEATLPYAPQLEGLSLPEVANMLEEVGTRLSVESLNWPQEFPYRPLTVVSAAHSGTHIFLDFLVRCNYLRAVNYTPNSRVSQDSCVEFYLQSDPASEDYWSLGFNCIGTPSVHFHSHTGSRYLSAVEMERIKVCASVGSRPFEEVEGSFIWSVTVAVPLDLFGLRYTAGNPLHMLGNFNKCASATSQPHYLSWAPIDTPHPDFHTLRCFAPIVLA